MTTEHRHPLAVRLPTLPVKPVWLCALESYRENHLYPGSTLAKLLANDVIGAFDFADETTRLSIPAILGYVLRELHPSSYGSAVKVDDWLALRNKEARGG